MQARLHGGIQYMTFFKSNALKGKNCADYGGMGRASSDAIAEVQVLTELL